MTGTETLPFVLCADDYGLAPGVGRAIRGLIAAGRLSATSCMTAGPHWMDEAAKLRPLADDADIGLHLTLTDQPPAGPMPLLAPEGRLPSVGRLMALAHTGRLNSPDVRAEIATETERQIKRFVEGMGRRPDHIDGHQHVHQLPVIRDVVIDAARGCPGANIRLCGEPLGAIIRRRVAAPKAALLSCLGRGLAARALRAGVPANPSFRGVYDLSDRVPFGELMESFLSDPVAGMLVMVHPGWVDAALRAADTLVERRAVEAEWLGGAAFGDLLARRRLTIRRFGATGD